MDKLWHTILWRSCLTAAAIAGLLAIYGHERIIRENTIIIRSADRWTKEDMRQWAEELGRLNPDLKLPEVK